jgi:hypothetical protein
MTITARTFALALSLVILNGPALAQAPAPKAEPKPASQGTQATEFPNTPEGAFKTFFMTMVKGDEAALREVTLPAEDFEYLLKGEHLPPDKIAEFRGMVEKMEIRRLKPGDKVNLPGGKVAVVQPEEVTEDRAVVLQEGSPIPTRCQKVKGRWRVDARPVIAGRRAAEQARKRAGEAPGKPKSR